MPICRYGLVSGRVQGVGFRQFVQTAARRAGLSGFAHNLPDGRVEVLLCGDEAAVQAVQTDVAHGPPSSRVVEVAWEDRPYAEVEGFKTSR
ncbi:MAG: acylphosphatase [Cellvibrionaceae bacterium]